MCAKIPMILDSKMILFGTIPSGEKQNNDIILTTIRIKKRIAILTDRSFYTYFHSEKRILKTAVTILHLMKPKFEVKILKNQNTISSFKI